MPNPLYHKNQYVSEIRGKEKRKFTKILLEVRLRVKENDFWLSCSYVDISMWFQENKDFIGCFISFD